MCNHFIQTVDNVHFHVFAYFGFQFGKWSLTRLTVDYLSLCVSLQNTKKNKLFQFNVDLLSTHFVRRRAPNEPLETEIHFICVDPKLKTTHQDALVFVSRVFSYFLRLLNVTKYDGTYKDLNKLAKLIGLKRTAFRKRSTEKWWNNANQLTGYVLETTAQHNWVTYNINNNNNRRCVRNSSERITNNESEVVRLKRFRLNHWPHGTIIHSGDHSIFTLLLYYSRWSTHSVIGISILKNLFVPRIEI